MSRESESGAGLTARDMELACTEAARSGFEVVRPGPSDLLIDLDHPRDDDRFDRLLALVDELFGIQSWEEWSSKDGYGRHVVMHLKVRLCAASRVALQAAVGSDPVREIRAIARLHSGVAEPSVLFKPPAKHEGDPHGNGN